MSEDDVLALLPKKYRKAFLKFDKSWTKNQHSSKKKNDLLHNFSEKYTMIPGMGDLWINLIRWSLLEEGESKYFKKTVKEIEKESMKHFPGQLTDEWPSYDRKIFSDSKKTLAEKLEYADFLLSFPHSKLSLALATWKELSTKATAEPKNLHLYGKNVEIFKEMCGADIIDGKPYIEALKKTENHEFVIKNVECILANKPWSKNLWIAYIQFLEENKKKDEKALLSVLQRYCRFFVNDKKMKEKYRSKFEEFSQSLDGISEFWIDSIKFELQFNGKDAAMAMVEKALGSNMKGFPQFIHDALNLARKYRLTNIEERLVAAKDQHPLDLPEPKKCDFERIVENVTFDNAKKQKLPFSKAVNQYLYDCIDYSHLRKLYQTCKWFSFKYRYNLVHKLEIHGRSYNPAGNQFSCSFPYFEYMDESIAFSPCKIETIKLHNLWLTNALSIVECYRISHLFPRLSKITLKYLHISATNIKKCEFETLTNSKTIVILKLSCQSIKDENDKDMVVEEILKHIPNARQIKIQPAYLTPKSAENLLMLRFNEKFDFLDLDFKQQINALMYYEFLEKNLQPKSEVCLYYSNGEDEYRDAMNKYFSQWRPKNETPTLSWCSFLGEIVIG